MNTSIFNKIFGRKNMKRSSTITFDDITNSFLTLFTEKFIGTHIKPYGVVTSVNLCDTYTIDILSKSYIFYFDNGKKANLCTIRKEFDKYKIVYPNSMISDLFNKTLESATFTISSYNKMTESAMIDYIKY